VVLPEAIQRSVERAWTQQGQEHQLWVLEPGEAPQACAQLPQVANMAMAAAAITAEASQPRVVSHGVNVNRPITWRRDAMSMIITMIGTAATFR
jgi:hypothetical protein